MPFPTTRQPPEATAMLETKSACHQLLVALHNRVNLAWKTVELGRLLRFCTVGLSGAVVHLGGALAPDGSLPAVLSTFGRGGGNVGDCEQLSVA